VATFTDLLATLDPDDSHRRGKQFEHVAKWFLLNEPEYRSRIKKVWLWDEWPGWWGKEAGIDLIAEDRDGQLWAIQAKAYDPKYSVTKSDIDTFFSESSRKQFSYRLLIATTDGLGSTARRTIDAQGKPVHLVLLTDLLDAAVSWPASIANLRPSPKPKPAKPRDYQRDAIRDVMRGFKTSDRGQLIMACGTGKTLTSLFVHEKLTAGRTVVLMPSLSLLKQTMKVWRVNAKTEFEALPVCSDETVGKDPDAVVSTTSEIGIPVTTDPAEIAAFLRKRSGQRVVFSTYQSSPRVAAALAQGRVPGFDLVIADEAHRAAGPVSSDFGTVLDAKAIKAKRRLFMTATPRYFTGRVLKAAQDAELEVASMDDETRFGAVFHRLSFGEAIKRDLLTDYQVVVVGVDDGTYREYAEKGTRVRLKKKMKTDARTLAGQIGLAKAMRRYDMHRMISFHSRVSRAREFAAEMPEVIAWMPARQRPKGKLWSDYASGEMTAGERHVRLRHLSRLGDGERGLLANARCLAEGVDVPTLDGVAFIDPRRSEVDIVQAVGRAIRLADDKLVGTIVIPVFIDTDADPETALDDSVFKPVWDVIKALRAHDEDLGEQIDSLRREMGRRGGVPKLPDKIRLDVPVKVGKEFAEAFDVRLVEQTTVSWEFWFGLLERYVEENGDAAVSASYELDGHRLGSWCVNQRSRHSRLSDDQVARLDGLPGWVWDRNESRWEDGLKFMRGYQEEHGNTLVSATHKYKGYPLGDWAAIQRRDYQNGKLSRERRDRLNVVPGWVWSLEEQRWEEGFCRLQTYIDTYENSLVTQAYETDDGFRLGAWVNFQRTRYSHGTLEADRVERLKQLPGWVWSASEAKWEKAFECLAEYAATYGTARVPRGYVVDGLKLGDWVVNQRAKWGKLSEYRRKKLKSLPGWAENTNTAQWEEGFQHLLDYVDEHGTAAVPRGYVIDGYRLGSWIDSRRNEYKRGTLDADRQNRLNDLPGWDWAPRAAMWGEGYKRLVAYTGEHVNARPPDNYVCEDGYRLGAWVRQQRTHYKGGELSDDRRKKLVKLNGWVWSPRAALWEESFVRLVEYAQNHSTARVPATYSDDDGYRLGTWAAQQRYKYADGTLDPEQAKRLAKLPGWEWTPSRSALIRTQR
jgi:superfamily II DNA or RNA helicase